MTMHSELCLKRLKSICWHRPFSELCLQDLFCAKILEFLTSYKKPKSIRGWCIEVNLTLTKQVWEWLSMINVLLRVETERKRSCLLVYAYTSIHFSQICEPGQAHCVGLTSLCDVQFFQSQSYQWRFNMYWLCKN